MGVQVGDQGFAKGARVWLAAHCHIVAIQKLIWLGSKPGFQALSGVYSQNLKPFRWQETDFVFENTFVENAQANHLL